MLASPLDTLGKLEGLRGVADLMIYVRLLVAKILKLNMVSLKGAAAKAGVAPAHRFTSGASLG